METPVRSAPQPRHEHVSETSAPSLHLLPAAPKSQVRDGEIRRQLGWDLISASRQGGK